MKKTVILLLLLSLFSGLSAQTADTAGKSGRFRNMALDFSAGYSVAMGDYASDDMNKEKPGYASNGYLIQAAFYWMGRKNFGMAVQYTFQKNPLQDTASRVMIDGMNNVMLGPGDWTNHYLLVGPVFMKTLKRFYFDARLLGGVILSTGPVFYTPDPADTNRMQYDKNLAPGFAWHFSAGAGFWISKNFAIKLNLGLQGGWPVANKQHSSKLLGYEDYYDPITGITYSQPVYSAPVEYTVKRVVTTLNPSFGVVYRF